MSWLKVHIFPRSAALLLKQLVLQGTRVSTEPEQRVCSYSSLLKHGNTPTLGVGCLSITGVDTY